MRPLREIEACFQGVIPGYLATTSAEGEPNVTAISIVHLLGPSRLGVSCQFMKKSLANLQATGTAQIAVLHPETLAEYAIDVRYAGMVESGPTFDRVRAMLDAIASQSGMSDTFALAGVAEFEVMDWRRFGDRDVPTGASVAPPAPVDPLELVAQLSATLAAANDLERLFDSLLERFDRDLGLRHSFVLFCDDAGERLYNVASHGFPEPNFGAEISVGEGLYGVAVARRIPVRSGSLRRERLLLAASRDGRAVDPTDLPLPGLRDAESSLAIPLVRGDRCLGALCFQSSSSGVFTDAIERILTVVAAQLAATIVAVGTAPGDVALSAKRGPVGARALATRVKFFESDGTVFFDDSYLIKGVAGRVLFRVLSNYVNQQRDEFSSKEIRLDPFIGLPAYKDNLEARLIALRKRLAERAPVVRIEHVARGRFRLEVDRELFLERLP